MGVASLVLGIISLVLAVGGACLLGWIGIPFAILGLILGILEKEKSGIRTGGIVTSIIGLAISLFWVLLLVVAGLSL